MIEEINKKYYESFIKFWIPIIQKQYFKAKIQNDLICIITIKENIWKNWHLSKEQKKAIWKEIGAKE